MKPFSWERLPDVGPRNRRDFLRGISGMLGATALTELFATRPGKAAEVGERIPGLPGLPHFAPQAKRVIFLFMSGGVSQFETFDHKPVLNQRQGEELPGSYRQRGLLGMSNTQASFPLVGSFAGFKQRGASGQWVSDLLPGISSVIDDLCVIRTVHTDAVNHDPAMSFMQSGAQLPGRPSFGSWLSYGLGSENADLPAFIVMISRRGVDQPLSSRLWDNGFLPSRHQGTQFRSSRDPVLFLGRPGGIDRDVDRSSLDTLGDLHRLEMARRGEPDLSSRISQYEMAFRMQMSVPEATAVDSEPASVKALYGPEVDKPGSFARNCLIARRLAERGVRFVQLYHPGWDHHGNLPTEMGSLTREIDGPCSALIADLKNRDLLKDTLVIWGTEFGRTCYSQGSILKEEKGVNYGREHHKNCCVFWLAGGGVKPGYSHGQTCDLGFDIANDPVHVNDLHATLLHLMGIDHRRFTYPFKGRNFRLTDVGGEVVKPILA
ncbi:MAG: DUF1501 domain-containing protein [Verrucomicrobiales bacterium]